MLKSDLHSNWLAVAILTLITALNTALAISFLVPGISEAALGLNSLQIAALIGLEVIGVAGCYALGSRNTTAVAF